MAKSNLADKVMSGMKWKAVERLFLQLINAATPMILARLLMPEDFGAVAILTVFISIANTFVNNGLGNAIVQKKESDDLDCSTVFYTQLFIAVVCYIILFFCAPLIGHIYNNNSLVPMLRVLSLSIVVGSLGAMQNVIMKKRMEFHKSFIIHVSATIAYGVVGISLAYMGFGCWSLVWAGLANSVVMRTVSVLVVKWKPTLAFSLTRLKMLFSYSWKLTVGWLIGTLHQDIYTLVIGKRFSPAVLGFYNRAGSFPQIITKTVTEVVDGVMFPALSQIQSEREKLVAVTKKLLSINSFVLFPMFLGLSACSANVIELLLTKKWLPAAPMMSIMCLTYALNSINNSNMQVFNSMGHSEVFMKLELIKRSVSIILLVLMSLINIYAVVLVLLLMAILSNCMNARNNKKLLGLSYIEQIKCIAPSFLLSAVMWIAVAAISFLKLNVFIELPVQVIAGAVIYIALSYIFKLEAFKDVTEQLLIKKERINDGKGKGGKK